MFRFLTAGESHGPQLTAVIEGIPAGLSLLASDIDGDLRRRQGGHGRGGRMKIESDRVQFVGGVRHGRTLGSPIVLVIENRDWENWRERMAVEPIETESERITRVRPGHADLAGALKYGHDDVRNVIERSSARETAMRVAVGAVCKRFLADCGVVVRSRTVAMGDISDETAADDVESYWDAVEHSPVRCGDSAAGARMVQAVDAAKRAGDTLGGVFEVIATGAPVGLGSYSQWDRRLGGQLAQALLSIPSSKGVEFGAGFAQARVPGSRVHDVLVNQPGSAWKRQTNNAGGLEGGISNGEPIVARVAVKPISTLAKPLPSVNMETGEAVEAFYERSDVTIVPAGGVVGEAMVAIVLTGALIEKCGGDSMAETLAHLERVRAAQRRPEPASEGSAQS